MSHFVDQFGSVGTAYAQFRPKYPQAVYDTLLSLTENGERDLAIDIGCGSGQATLPLAQYFKKVIGVEPSAGQLESVQVSAPNLEFRQAPAEKIPLPDASVDLIVSAQASHWFDFEAFFDEVDRLLKPNGSLALWGYGLAVLPNEIAQKLFEELYLVTLKDYWSQPGVSILDSAYRAIVPPAAKFASVTRKDDLQIVQPETTVASFIGYLGSWSGVARYKQMHPDKPSPLVELQAKLEQHLGDKPFTVTFPIFMVLVKRHV